MLWGQVTQDSQKGTDGPGDLAGSPEVGSPRHSCLHHSCFPSSVLTLQEVNICFPTITRQPCISGHHMASSKKRGRDISSKGDRGDGRDATNRVGLNVDSVGKGKIFACVHNDTGTPYVYVWSVGHSCMPSSCLGAWQRGCTSVTTCLVLGALCSVFLPGPLHCTSKPSAGFNQISFLE